MVICPWCGTNYPVFQSNCSRCGGQIPASSFRSIPQVEAEVVLPEPPPRAISTDYRWKIMLADAWSLVAFVFGLIGVIFLLVGGGLTFGVVTAFVGLPLLGLGLLSLSGSGVVFYKRYQEALKVVQILTHGEAALGLISQVETNYSVMVNGRNPLKIVYQYQVGGRDYQGNISTLNALNLPYQAGQKMCVLYLPGAPDYSSLYPHP